MVSLPLLRARFENGRSIPDRFPPEGRIGGHPQGVVWARTDRPEVRWYSETGGLARILRWEQEPVEVTDSVWRAYVDAFVSTLVEEVGFDPERAADTRRTLNSGRASSSPDLPLFGRLSVGSDGTTWLAEYTVMGESIERFIVMSRAGEWLGRVAVPPSFTFLDARDGFVLGVQLDELDVPALGLYRIELGGS